MGQAIGRFGNSGSKSVILETQGEGEVERRTATFKDQERLSQFMQNNGYSGLEPVVLSSITGNTPALRPVPVWQIEDLVHGAVYRPVLNSLSRRIDNMEGYQRNIIYRQEQELGGALAAQVELDYGLPLGSVREVPELRYITDEQGRSKFEFDAVVVRTLKDGALQFYVAEHKTLAKDTQDVTKFSYRVKEAEAFLATGPPHAFKGKPLKLVYMAEYTTPKAEPKVAQKCRELNIMRMKRGTGGIKKVCAAASGLRGCRQANCTVRAFC
mmetsp:Transcript_16597/g.41451  ORF Transcript_16597/g.41451 Transcript_16597/m.41451 type:complete len:269 (-) Transcript_16597:700-1506(-)